MRNIEDVTGLKVIDRTRFNIRHIRTKSIK